MVLKCVIIDDSQFVRETLTDMIQKEGHEVASSFDSGEPFLGILDKLDIDLVFLDLILPTISGLDILRAIQQQDRKMKVIVLSGVTIGGTISTALRLGATDFVAKPINPEKLTNLLEKFSSEFKIPDVEELSRIGIGCLLINKFIAELNSHVFSSLRNEISNQCRSILEYKKNKYPNMFTIDLHKIEIHPDDLLWGNYSEKEVFDVLKNTIGEIRDELCFLYPEDFIDSLLDQTYLTYYARPNILQLIAIVPPQEVGLKTKTKDVVMSSGVQASTTFEELETSLSFSVFTFGDQGPMMNVQINDHLIDEIAVIKNNIFYSTIVHDDDQFKEGLYGPLPVSSDNDLSALVYICKLLDNINKDEHTVFISIYFTPNAATIVSDYNRLSFIIKTRLSNVNYLEELDKGVLRNLLTDTVNFILEN